MTYFQNVFTADYQGIWVLDDRKHTPKFKIKGNSGRGDTLVTVWNQGPYDLSGTDADGDDEDELVINFSFRPNDFQDWHSITVNVAGATPAATTPNEIAVALNNEPAFSTHFIAEVKNKFPGSSIFDRLSISQIKPIDRMRFYIVNGKAESVLRFNARAGVAELPSYFHRDIVTLGLTLTEIENFTENGSINNLLLELDPSNSGGASAVDDDIVDQATDKDGNSLGLDSSTTQDDWELLDGNSGAFLFKKQTIDGSDRVTEIIEYRAGADVGDFAKKTVFTYTGANTNPDEIFQLPHVLVSGDLITPP